MKNWNGYKERFGSDIATQTIVFKRGLGYVDKLWGDIKDIPYRRLMRLALAHDFFGKNMPTTEAIMKLMRLFNGGFDINKTGGITTKPMTEWYYDVIKSMKLWTSKEQALIGTYLLGTACAQAGLIKLVSNVQTLYFEKYDTLVPSWDRVEAEVFLRLVETNNTSELANLIVELGKLYRSADVKTSNALNQAYKIQMYFQEVVSKIRREWNILITRRKIFREVLSYAIKIGPMDGANPNHIEKIRPLLESSNVFELRKSLPTLPAGYVLTSDAIDVALSYYSSIKAMLSDASYPMEMKPTRSFESIFSTNEIKMAGGGTLLKIEAPPKQTFEWRAYNVDYVGAVGVQIKNHASLMQTFMARTQQMAQLITEMYEKVTALEAFYASDKTTAYVYDLNCALTKDQLHSILERLALNYSADFSISDEETYEYKRRVTSQLLHGSHRLDAEPWSYTKRYTDVVVSAIPTHLTSTGVPMSNETPFGKAVPNVSLLSAYRDFTLSARGIKITLRDVYNDAIPIDLNLGVLFGVGEIIDDVLMIKPYSLTVFEKLVPRIKATISKYSNLIDGLLISQYTRIVRTAIADYMPLAKELVDRRDDAFAHIARTQSKAEHITALNAFKLWKLANSIVSPALAEVITLIVTEAQKPPVNAKFIDMAGVSYV